MSADHTPSIGLDPNQPQTGMLLEDWSIERSDVVSAKLSIFQKIYVDHPPHTALHGRWYGLMSLGRATQGQPQKGIRTIALTGSGKTKAASTFVRRMHPPGSAGFPPVAHVALEKATTSKRLIGSLLQWYGDRHTHSGTEARLKERLYACFERFGTQLLIIDEVQHLNHRSGEKGDVTDTLKRLLDDGVVPIAFLGTEEAEDLFARNLQLNGRLLPPCDLPPLRRDDPEDRRLFGEFLVKLDAAIVTEGLVPMEAGLGHRWVRACLAEISGGVIGRVCRVVGVALDIALRREAERIEVYDLALATDRWAIAQGFAKVNPFRTSLPPA